MVGTIEVGDGVGTVCCGLPGTSSPALPHISAGGTLVIATWCQREETPQKPFTQKEKVRSPNGACLQLPGLRPPTGPSAGVSGFACIGAFCNDPLIRLQHDTFL